MASGNTYMSVVPTFFCRQSFFKGIEIPKKNLPALKNAAVFAERGAMFAHIYLWSDRNMQNSKFIRDFDLAQVLHWR